MFISGEDVVRIVPMQDGELGEPLKIGDTFTIVEVYHSGNSISFNTYGLSYKSKYFARKEPIKE